MKRYLLSLAVAGLALAAAAPAAAAPFITIVTGSGTFGNNDLSCVGVTAPCTFTDTINFTTPAGYNLVSLTLSSSQVDGDTTTNVDFTTAALNGANFTVVSTGLVEFRYLLSQGIGSGATNTLTIAGTTGGNGSYAGTIEFALAPSVPEPATWAMMITGFGMVGFAMRRRQKVATNVFYAG